MPIEQDAPIMISDLSRPPCRVDDVGYEDGDEHPIPVIIRLYGGRLIGSTVTRLGLGPCSFRQRSHGYASTAQCVSERPCPVGPSQAGCATRNLDVRFRGSPLETSV